MRLSIITYFLIVSVFSSCYSNAIYFDVNAQSICSCNAKEIRQVYIKNDSSSEVYLISWTDTILVAPKIINLKNIETGYSLYKGWNKKQISINEFKLAVLSTYTIERVQDDATTYKVKVWTDKTGNINKTSRSTCND